MIQLTPRQVQILKIIVEEYINTAQPVGSEMLDRKHNLGVSPATIRNEMVQLVRLGMLKQPHVSSGRIPTPAALKFYVTELMKEEDLPVTEEASVKERMWDARTQPDALLREAVRALADKSHCIGVAITAEHKTYHAGYYHLLDEPEFYDIDVTRTVFSLLDRTDELIEIMLNEPAESSISVLLGDDFENRHLQPVGFVFSDFNIGGQHGSIGVIGPARLNFGYVIPLVRHLSHTLEEIANR